MKYCKLLLIFIIVLAPISPAHAWFDETHLAIAKAGGYKKWYNAAGADVARIKLGRMEGYNHFHNSPQNVVITADTVLQQAQRYDTNDPDGHLYGAIIGAFRKYVTVRQNGGYAENHMAFLVHYIGDLSMPLHHTLYNAFNKKFHLANDGIVENNILAKVDQIKPYRITIGSEVDLAKEVARIANLSKELGYRLEEQHRLMTKEEAYTQIGHSASLLRAVLEFIGN